jgi:tetratricopeptide (TPR) repeat protein
MGSDLFKITKGTKVILVITFVVSLVTFTFAYFYYRGINRLEDPRVKKAREFLAEYDQLSTTENPIELFSLLDSASAIYSSFPDYQHSFELGVILNNKSSALIISALYDSTLSLHEKNTVLSLAQRFCDSSITNYKDWMIEWGSLSPDEIAFKIKPDMHENDPAFQGFNYEKIVEKRVGNIIDAQVETPRRLSVSLTNKGTIYRHTSRQDSALLFYKEALDIWKDNRIAKSNLNVLIGGEPIKPSVIESLFPPDKKKR